jgi:hypothetical protein
MINHIRTVLLNEDGTARMDGLFPMEEYVPYDYKKTKLTAPVDRVWRTLFNSNPDRAYKNFRLYQLSCLARCSALVDLWTSKDSRITHFDTIPDANASQYGTVRVYRNGSFVRYSDSPGWLTKISTVSESSQITDEEVIGAYPSGMPECDESKGKCKSSWSITVDVSNNYSVSCLDKNVFFNGTLSFTNGLSAPITLTGSGISIKIKNGNTGLFTVEILATPSTDIGTVLKNLDNMNQADIAEVMNNGDENSDKLKGYWTSSTDLADRLTAMTLALGYKIDSLRSKA